ncbi:MAG TPA: pyrroloquinoline quinone precursor peptide PqqA [Stellaceae bacterium]|nr:pyrroloquinoline quinone precursor peptide PqqA [Stellaceae bacterium]
MLGAQRLDSGDRLRDRVVAKARRLGKDESCKAGPLVLRLSMADRGRLESAEHDHQRTTLPLTKPVGSHGFELTRFRRRHTLNARKIRAKEMAMKWKTPVIIEIAVGLEINAYACAEVK